MLYKAKCFVLLDHGRLDCVIMFLHKFSDNIF